MSGRASVPQLPCDFDAFLFATIGTDRNGMLLSVASALARRDIDPWREAAELAGLPEKTAIGRLTSLIGAPRGGASMDLDAGATAARLIALLPHRGVPGEASSKWRPTAGAAANDWSLLIVLYAIVTLFVLGAQLAAGSRPVVGNAGSVHSQAVRTATPSALSAQGIGRGGETGAGKPNAGRARVRALRP